MNSAFMAKPGWKILTEKNKLWAKVITSKYMKGEAAIPKLVEKKGASNIWRGVASAGDVIRKGTCITVGNGRTTFFWRENWLEPWPLIQVASREVPLVNSCCMVHEYWDKERGWKRELLRDFLPPHILNRMGTFLLREEEDAEDELHWEPTSTGIFSVKSAYTLALEDQPTSHTVGWKTMET